MSNQPADLKTEEAAHENAPKKCLTFWGQYIIRDSLLVMLNTIYRKNVPMLPRA